MFCGMYKNAKQAQLILILHCIYPMVKHLILMGVVQYDNAQFTVHEICFNEYENDVNHMLYECMYVC